jgi:uncharacterized OB-fold protein
MSPTATEPDDDGTVKMMDYFMQLEYRELICPVVRRYADQLLEGRLIGHKCPSCGLVYLPPRGYCPICVIETTDADEVVLSDRGTVTNYTVVTPVQYYGQHETDPFVRASVTLDGDNATMNLQDLVDVPVDEVRVGMRVAAVWKPKGERSVADISNRSWGSAEGCIEGWRPTGEPDVPAEQFLGKATF